MTDGKGYEQLGLFYLGRELDMVGDGKAAMPLLLKSKDFTTHAAIIGMTGSGKTGLGIGLIEEAIMDNIPSIIIDPKGDMANLLLTFPRLDAADFLPWIDPAEAARKEMTPEAYAVKIAKDWQAGLQSHDQDQERIATLRRKANFTIYTPGSSLGAPVSALADFAAPPPDVLRERDTLNALVGSTATSLLSLVDIEGDPLQSREHILVSSLLSHHWGKGENLTLESLISGIVSPPFAKIGVFAMDTFFPPKDRLALAMSLNNIIASPSFSAWSQGAPLDIQRILYDENGGPQTAIFSIAHLSDGERMFFVTLLLNQVIAWMRRQEGTSSLKALLYMDEIFGYFPPTANPPSKKPMLLLLKQARAYGLGVILATQNPVDLDYRGLANIGAWFVGRLQTSQDQERVVGGISGASEGKLDRAEVKSLLSRLKGRQFLLTSAHLEEPIVFETRWTMSYLKGPIAGDDIRRLMTPAGGPSDTIPQAASPQQPHGARIDATTNAAPPVCSGRPLIAAGVEQQFYARPTSNDAPVFEPWLAGRASVRFYNAAKNIDETRQIALGVSLDEHFMRPDWAKAETIPFSEDDCLRQPPGGSRFSEPPTAISTLKDLKSLQKTFSDFLYQSERLELFRVSDLQLESRPGEPFGDFKVRITDALRGKKDLALEEIKKKYAARQRAIEQKLAAAQDKLEREQSDVTAKTTDTLISFGVAVVSAFLGRKTFSASNVSRAATGFKSAGRLIKERSDVQVAEESIAQLRQELAGLATEIEAEATRLAAACQPDALPLESFTVKPRRGDIFDVRMALLWQTARPGRL
ncbi:MAG: DUF87 domain-containing protein [Desulfobulbaceae bacterium]|jgi:hypothetical protein|nr:DUF87 domain-containing protein [Desulfobulbaceae bacterium]